MQNNSKWTAWFMVMMNLFLVVAMLVNRGMVAMWLMTLIMLCDAFIGLWAVYHQHQ
ncbi:hypothetical protein [Lacticaseibacillus sp. N501-2]|uniref:hypothetical protein n=1 Tax=Lacticaseibacillus salsurae TaxID=3367729 RepID=UPI0038B2BBC9